MSRVTRSSTRQQQVPVTTDATNAKIQQQSRLAFSVQKRPVATRKTGRTKQLEAVNDENGRALKCDENTTPSIIARKANVKKTTPPKRRNALADGCKENGHGTPTAKDACSPQKTPRRLNSSPLKPTNGNTAVAPMTAPVGGAASKYRTRTAPSDGGRAKQKLSFDADAASRGNGANENTAVCRAKANLSLALPNRLLERDREMAFLQEHVAPCVRRRQPACFYVSGAPGTGKTATVRFFLNKLKESGVSFHYIYQNCMSVRNPKSVYRYIHEQLQEEEDIGACPSTAQAVADSVVQIFTSTQKSIVLVLDEIDQLETRNHDVLYKAFQWSSLPKSKLILIGIANSLDLTERLLPKLKLSASVRPTLLMFEPYKKDEVVAILKHRLLEADGLLDPAAVELCARKVSAVTGDIRKALDICKIAIEHADHTMTTTVTTPSTSRHAGTDDVTASSTKPVVGCREILATVKSVYGSKTASVGAKLPLQQKMVLASALALTTSGNHLKQFSPTQLCSAYRKACISADVPPIDISDLLSVCQLLESQGLLGQIKQRGKTAGDRNIMLRLLVDENSVCTALNDEALVTRVLNTNA